MFATALLTAEETTHVVTELPMPPLAYGLLAFGALIGLLCVTLAFRSVWTRH
ncbi:MAG: hypothetical protein ACTMIR_11180 [Cellulomonadaceae bacterium]